MSDKYESLRKKLSEEFEYPIKYMYKFIVPNGKVQELLPYFETAEITKKKSKTGKYISISAVILAFSAEEIIDKYKSIEHLKGVISL